MHPHFFWLRTLFQVICQPVKKIALGKGVSKKMVKGCFNTPLGHTPKRLLTGYNGIPFIVGQGDCLGCALRVCCNFLGINLFFVAMAWWTAQSLNLSRRKRWKLYNGNCASRRSCCFVQWQTRWWFQIFFIVTPTWGRFPFWLICYYVSNGLKPRNSKNLARWFSDSFLMFTPICEGNDPIWRSHMFNRVVQLPTRDGNPTTRMQLCQIPRA